MAELKIGGKYMVKSCAGAMHGFELGDIVTVTRTDVNGIFKNEIQHAKGYHGYCAPEHIEPLETETDGNDSTLKITDIRVDTRYRVVKLPQTLYNEMPIEDYMNVGDFVTVMSIDDDIKFRIKCRTNAGLTVYCDPEHLEPLSSTGMDMSDMARIVYVREAIEKMRDALDAMERAERSLAKTPVPPAVATSHTTPADVRKSMSTRPHLIDFAKRHVNAIVDDLKGGCITTKFRVNRNAGVVVARTFDDYDGELLCKGIARCMPGDVFNETVGKYIALCRCEGINPADALLDMPPPEKLLPGMRVKIHKYDDVLTLKERRPSFDAFGFGEAWSLEESSGWLGEQQFDVIDDSAAIYE